MAKAKGTNRYEFTTGSEKAFKEETGDIMFQYVQKTWGSGYLKRSTMKGVDHSLCNVPMEWTANFREKNPTTLTYEGMTVLFGVRWGRNREAVNTPVLVIGVESCWGASRFANNFTLNGLKAKINEIIEAGMDVYFNATEAFFDAIAQRNIEANTAA